jgi:hypothetical protein
MQSIRTLRPHSAIGARSWRALPSRLLQDFAGLFTTSTPAERSNARTLVMLAAIVAIGTFVRFWDLGAVGLHGDEETMAMPTMHIVEHGSPRLPSGMLYPRGIGQLYMMAGSVELFGESEWAFRIPSALCGVLLIVLAYRAGQRFLAPAWNLAFTATVALLPALIADSQTARMYIFLETCVVGYALLLFEWERTDKLRYLIGAVLVLLVGIQFHTLAVFAAFLAFYPGLVRGEWHKVLLGAAAFVVIVAGFAGVDHWIASQYPPPTEMPGDIANVPSGARAAAAIPQLGWWFYAAALAVGAALAAIVARRVNGALAAATTGGALALALFAQVAFSYHVAALLAATGLIIGQRYGRVTMRSLLPLAAIGFVIAAAQIYVLHVNGVESLRQIFGAMAGRPSLWPYPRIAEYSEVAALLFAAGIVVSLWRLAQRRPVPDFILFGVLGVWIPLLLIGMFKWNVPMRYTAAQIMPMLLCAFAVAQWFFARSLRWQAAVAAGVAVLAINPFVFAREVGVGYANSPDHKGAAEYMRSIHPGPRDIILAEDVLEQTYYLGHVDYWLISRDVVTEFVRMKNGRLRDMYTDVPLLGTAEELEELIARPDRGAIYVIGSGENQADGRRHARGPGLSALLQSPRFKEVWRGRDNLTVVLKVPPPGAPE